MNENSVAHLLTKLAAIAQKIRERRPVVHQITNYVSATDCANITLAAGASPIMADELLEMTEIVPRVDSLVLNMGTFRAERKRTMAFAAKIAAAHHKPIVLDPVGVGASRLRRSAIATLLDGAGVTVVRGNASEAAALLNERHTMRGVDADQAIASPRATAEELAQMIGRTVAVTGATDYLSDGRRGLAIDNGHLLMTCITGAGCMTSSVVGACLAVEPDPFLAAAAALLTMGIAAEKAAEQAAGPGSFHAALFDAVFNLSKEDYEARGRVRLWGNWTCVSI